jgi:hypothetical protein
VPDPVLLVDQFEELYTGDEAVAARAGRRPPPTGTHASMLIGAAWYGVASDVGVAIRCAPPAPAIDRRPGFCGPVANERGSICRVWSRSAIRM